MKRPCESPTQLLRRRALEQMNNPQSSEGGSNSRPTSGQSGASTVPSPVSYDKILEGVIAFVEVKTGTKDRSDAVKAHLQTMGAVIREKITKDVTHVIFKDGSFTTYQKANLLKVHLVSVLWLEACKSSHMKVSEKNYPAIGTEAYDHNVSALCSQMQKDYEDIIHEEFQRSIQAGTPLPSAKALIDRRRTIVMTPAGKEVQSFTRRSLQAGPSGTIRLTPDGDITDDESDLGPLIDGDIVDRSSDLFEDFVKTTPVKNGEVLSKTSNNHEDMELTDLQKSPLLPPFRCSSPDSSPEIYTIQTQQAGKSVSKTPRNEEVNDDDIYRRRTAVLNNLDVDNICTPENGRKSRVRTPRTCRIFNKDDVLTPDESNALTPRSLHIFSKNISRGTPDITKSNKEKGSAPNLTTETDSSVAQTFSKPTEKSTSTNMSSLRISEESKNNSKSTGKTSFESCKTSFSPLQANLVNNILKTLQNNSSMADKSGDLENDTSNQNPSLSKNKDTSYDKVKVEEIETKNTSSDKAKSLSFEHVTLRKKRIPKEKDTINEEESKITQDLFQSEDELVENGLNEVKQSRNTRRKTLAASTGISKNQPENQKEVSSENKYDGKKVGKSKNVQANIRNVARALEKEFETSDEDIPIEKPKGTDKSKNKRATMSGSDVKENIGQTANVQVKDDSNIKKREKRVIKQNRRQTMGPLVSLQEIEYSEPKSRANRRKTLAPSTTEKVSAIDKSSPTNNESNEPKSRPNRRKTLAPSNATTTEKVSANDQSSPPKIESNEAKLKANRRKTLASSDATTTEKVSANDQSSPAKNESNEAKWKANRRKTLPSSDATTTEKVSPNDQRSPEKNEPNEAKSKANRRKTLASSDATTTEKVSPNDQRSPEKNEPNEAKSKANRRKTLASSDATTTEKVSPNDQRSPEKNEPNEAKSKANRRKTLASSDATTTEKVSPNDQRSPEKNEPNEAKSKANRRKTLASSDATTTEKVSPNDQRSPEKNEPNEAKSKANRRKTLASSDALTKEKVSASDKGSPAKKAKTSPPDKGMSEFSEPKSRENRRKTVAPSTTENVSSNDQGSPAKKVKTTPVKASTRRQTISASAVKPKRDDKEILRRTMSSTDVNNIDVSIPPDSQPRRRFRRLYSPTALQEICIDDNRDRQEKRLAKKVIDDPGVFKKPIIVSQKMQNLLDKNNIDIENIINPLKTNKNKEKSDDKPEFTSDDDEELELLNELLNKKPNKNKKKKDDKPEFNSDDDEQVSLLNELLNKKKNMEPPKESTKSSVIDKSNTDNQKIKSNDRRLSTRIKLKEKSQTVSKTPKTPQKRNLTLKCTPSTSVRNRRSTQEFQLITQSAKKRLKIDKPVQPSIVCTKMHKEEVQTFMQIVKKLGGFQVEDEVTSKTTHLVVGEPKRTINMLRALTRGCWVLKKEWVSVNIFVLTLVSRCEMQLHPRLSFSHLSF
uniref:Claspin n=1 Tax=Diabrotica virgifera virgifera TaxID=50390 RepID=A0A6P7HD50_DIAVI